MPQEFSAPSPEEMRELARKWVSVERLVKEDYGYDLSSELQTLDVLQRVLDDDLVGDNTYALQCLGCVLGRVMVENIPGLDWVSARDDTGTDLCLRYADTSLCIYPLTMISKRVERREGVSVRVLYRQIEADIRKLANEVD